MVDRGPFVEFLIAESHFAVPLSAAERVHLMVAVSCVPGAPAVVLGAINLEGGVVPVVDLRRRLDLPLRDYGVDAHLLILHTPRRRLAVAADEVLGVSEVDPSVIAPAEAVLPGLVRITGIAARPGGLLLVYDIEAFLTSNEESRLDQALGEAPA